MLREPRGRLWTFGISRPRSSYTRRSLPLIYTQMCEHCDLYEFFFSVSLFLPPPSMCACLYLHWRGTAFTLFICKHLLRVVPSRPRPSSDIAAFPALISPPRCVPCSLRLFLLFHESRDEWRRLGLLSLCLHSMPCVLSARPLRCLSVWGLLLLVSLLCRAPSLCAYFFMPQFSVS